MVVRMVLIIGCLLLIVVVQASTPCDYSCTYNQNDTETKDCCALCTRQSPIEIGGDGGPGCCLEDTDCNRFGGADQNKTFCRTDISWCVQCKQGYGGPLCQYAWATDPPDSCAEVDPSTGNVVGEKYACPRDRPYCDGKLGKCYGAFEDEYAKCLFPQDTIVNVGGIAEDNGEEVTAFFDDFNDGFINPQWWYVANGVKSASPENVVTRANCSPKYPEGVSLPQWYNKSGAGCVVIKAQGMKHPENTDNLTASPYFPSGPHASARYGTGGLLVTKGYYASGRFEVGVKPLGEHGMSNSIWTYAMYSNGVCEGVNSDKSQGQPYCPNDYHTNPSLFGCWYNVDPQNPHYMPDFCQGNAYSGVGNLLNQEIDIEQPSYAWGTAGGDDNCTNVTWTNARLNTYSHSDQTSFSNFTVLQKEDGTEINLADGLFHVYRFDWRTTRVKVPGSDSWGSEAQALQKGYIKKDFVGNSVITGFSLDDSSPKYSLLNYQGHVVSQKDSEDDGAWYAHKGLSVDFYIDDVLQSSFSRKAWEADPHAPSESFTGRDNTEITNPEIWPFVPWMSQRLWIGLWPATFSFPACHAGDIDPSMSFDEGEMLIDYVAITPYHDEGDVTNYPESTITTWTVTNNSKNCTSNCGYPGLADWQGGYVGSSRIIDPSMCTISRRPSKLVEPTPETSATTTCETSGLLQRGCFCRDNSMCGSNCCSGEPLRCQSASVCQSGDCSMSKNKPNGCSCSSSGACETGCCSDGQCRPSSECSAPSDPCSTNTSRPLGCKCSTENDCNSNCCQNSICQTTDKCKEDPCVASPKPSGCSCSSGTQCDSSCCLSTGKCAEKASDCKNDGCDQPLRPNGCTCSHKWDCSSNCCTGTCEDTGICSSTPPPPPVNPCINATGRPTNCTCEHKYQCESNCCDGVPARCQPDAC